MNLLLHSVDPLLHGASQRGCCQQYMKGRMHRRLAGTDLTDCHGLIVRPGDAHAVRDLSDLHLVHVAAGAIRRGRLCLGRPLRNDRVTVKEVCSISHYLSGTGTGTSL